MESIMMFLMAALDPLKTMALHLVAIGPMIIASVLLLVLGAFLGRFARQMVDRLMDIIRVDEYSRKVGVSMILDRLGMGSSLKRLVGIIVHAVIVLAFVLASAEAVGIAMVSEFLGRVVVFLPVLIAVSIVLGGGLFIGHLCGHIVFRSAVANHVKGAEALSKVIYGIVVIFSGLLALEVLGIETGILLNSMQIILASIGLGCAIAFGVAFGMAGRDLASKLIHDLNPRHSSKGRKIDLKKAA